MCIATFSDAKEGDVYVFILKQTCPRPSITCFDARTDILTWQKVYCVESQGVDTKRLLHITVIKVMLFKKYTY